MNNETPYTQVRVLSRRETIQVIGVDERTFDRLEAAGDAPPKTQLSKRRIGYRLANIDAWLNGRRRVVS
jgi:predicted DNA-binding transcriptional regulator AlpA